MSTSKSRPKTTSPKSEKNSTAKVDKKYDELNRTIESLRSENDELKRKFKLICKRIVDNVDLSEYAFIDINQIEPDQIELNDLLHMVQKLALMASQVWVL